MAKRDTEKAQINKTIREMSERLDVLLPHVLEITGYKNVHQLNAKFGSKHVDFLDIRNQVIYSPEQFTALWMDGFRRELETRSYNKENSELYKVFRFIKEHEEVREYMMVFLERTYLRNFEQLSKKRPSDEDSIMWIGQENASYGLLITPRFRNGNWENDKSEIRRFNKGYWTIGHILQTGLVVPFEDDVIRFHTINEYLSFFQHTLVRASGSIHEKKLAKLYCDYVRERENPQDVPLLIPEFRYGGLVKRHEYRLDFCIIDPFTLSKIGFELSPWSTHGALTGINGLNQKTINEMALGNFEREMKKLKDYFRKYGVFVLIYTDSDLQDIERVFEDVKRYLNPQKDPVQLKISALNNLLNFVD